MKLTDAIAGLGLDAGKLVLSPTRTYAPVVKAILDEMSRRIHGMVHCSGGAQPKVMHVVKNKRVVKDNFYPTPPLLELIPRESQTEWSEMYKVFNMGHRLEVYLSEENASRVIEISESFGIPARSGGRGEEAPTNELILQTPYGEIRY